MTAPSRARYWFQKKNMVNIESDKKLAERLKQARESMGLALENLAILTKIQKKYLTRLESGQYDKLPSGVFVVGFLKRCAKVLNLDANEIIDQYRKERGLSDQKDRQTDGFGGVKSGKILSGNKSVFVITPKIFSAFVALLVFLAIFLFFWHQMKFLIGPPKLILEDPANDFVTLNPSLTLKGLAEIGANLTVNGRRLEVSKEGKFFDYVNLSAGLNLIEIKAANKFGKSKLISRKIILNQ